MTVKDIEGCLLLECVKESKRGGLSKGDIYHAIKESLDFYWVKNDIDRFEWYDKDFFITMRSKLAINPQHYNKGDIDLYESWYLTRPFNEFRAIMESVAERYMKRDKLDRLEDLDKCMETLRRLREYELRHKEENDGIK